MIPSSYFFKSSRIILYQIGEAPVAPEAILGFIGLLSLFPTQTPTVIDLVKPTAQLSRLSSVVPVLTATVFPGMFRYEFGPNSSILALLSDKIWESKNETSG